MKSKIEYEKLDYDFYSLSELRYLFEKGNLYYKSCDQYFQFKDNSDLTRRALAGDSIYTRTDEEDLEEIEEDILGIIQSNAGHDLQFFFDDGKVKVFESIFESSIRHMINLDPDTIHELSDLLKQHGK